MPPLPSRTIPRSPMRRLWTMTTTTIFVTFVVATVSSSSSRPLFARFSKASRSPPPLKNMSPSSTTSSLFSPPSSWWRRWRSPLADVQDAVVESHRGRRRMRIIRRRRRGSAAVWGIGYGGGTGPSSPSSSSSSSSEGNRDDAIRRLIERHGGSSSPIADGAGGKYDAVLMSSTTSIDDALRMANANARLLVCYISKGIGGGGRGKNNNAVVPCLLSSEMARLANRDPFGKKGKKKSIEERDGGTEKKMVTKKKKNKEEEDKDGENKSFYIWITDDDDHVDTATRRLRAKPIPTRRKGPSSSSASATSSKSKSKSKSSRDGPPPILAIVCPTASIDTSSSGMSRILPKILAQHHCNPPPSSSASMSSWANAARKRYLIEYARLRKLRDEARLLRERNEGYASSVRDDAAREIAEGERLANERRILEEERMRLSMLEERRAVLLANLPHEPPSGTTEGIVTIALRFADNDAAAVVEKYGRDGLKRRFVASEATMNDVFDWIDAKFGYERERLILSTMNGSRKFAYVTVDDDDDDVGDGGDGDGDEDGYDDDDEVGEGDNGGRGGKKNDPKNLTLEEAGLGKLIALRVTEIVGDVSAAKADEEE